MSKILKKSTSHANANSKGFVNILSGALRGKKLSVITSPGLRPIGSRVKETFFNWIQFEVSGRKVLDLFAGSGALGLEALSRGCQSLTMCEYARDPYLNLQNNYKSINLNSLKQAYGFVADVEVKQLDSYSLVKQTSSKSYDLVFVDPPFMQEKELTVLEDLANNGFLEEGAIVFLQIDAAYQNLLTSLDDRFSIRKEKKIGNILLYLLDFQTEEPELDFEII